VTPGSRAEREALEALAQRQQRRERAQRPQRRSGSSGTTAGGTEAGRAAAETTTAPVEDVVAVTSGDVPAEQTVAQAAGAEGTATAEAAGTENTAPEQGA
jgi:small subunit ribosomal protein S3